MSSKFAQKMRIQPTPKVCKSTDCGPRYMDATTADRRVAFWWDGTDDFGGPVHVQTLLPLQPVPAVPGNWNGKRTIAQLNFIFSFFYNPQTNLLTFLFSAERHSLLFGDGQLVGNPYGKKLPFDTGPLGLQLTTGSGSAGFRVTL